MCLRYYRPSRIAFAALVTNGVRASPVRLRCDPQTITHSQADTRFSSSASSGGGRHSNAEFMVGKFRRSTDIFDLPLTMLVFTGGLRDFEGPGPGAISSG